MRARNLSVLVAAVAVGMLAITTCSKPKSVLQPPQTIEGKLIAEAYEEDTANLFEEIAQRLKISPGELYAAIGFYQEQKGKEMVTAAPGETGIIYHLPVSITKMNDQELGRYFVRS